MPAGHRGFYREVGATPDTFPTGGTFAPVPWDTVLGEDTATIQQVSANSPDFTLKEVGTYLYRTNISARGVTGSGGTRSAPAISPKLAGVSVPEGRSSGFLIRTQGASEAFPWSMGLIKTAVPNEVFTIEASSVDSNTGQLVERMPDTSGLEIIKLDDTWPRLRMRKALVSPTTTLAWQSMSWAPGTDLLENFGSGPGTGFLLSPVDNANVNSLRGGFVLVGGTLTFQRIAGVRCVPQVRLRIDGVLFEFPGFRPTINLESNNDCNTGSISFVRLIKLNPGQSFRLEYRHENDLTGAANPLGGNVCCMWALELPNWPDVALLQGSALQPANSASVVPLNFNFAEVLHPETYSWSPTTNPDDVTVLQARRFLLVGSGYVIRTQGASAEHKHWRGQVRIDGTLLQVGGGGAYSRGTDATNGSNLESGYSCGAIGDVALNSLFEYTNKNEGSTLTADGDYQGVAYQMYDLTAAFAPPVWKVRDSPQIVFTAGLATVTFSRPVAGASPQISLIAPIGLLGVTITFPPPTGTPPQILFTAGNPEGQATLSVGQSPAITFSAGLPTRSAQSFTVTSSPLLQLIAGAASIAGPVLGLDWADFSANSGAGVSVFPTITGGAPSIYALFPNPWDALFAPVTFSASEITGILTSQAQIECDCTTNQVKILRGSNGHDGEIITTPRIGSTFNPLAEAIWYAGHPGYFPDSGTIPIYIAFRGTNLAQVAIGAGGITGGHPNEVFWTTNGSVLPNQAITRPIKNLYVIGLATPQGGPDQRTINYPDRISNLRLGAGIATSATTKKQAGFDDITFIRITLQNEYQGLDGGGNHVYSSNAVSAFTGAAANIGEYVSTGKFRLWDCNVMPESLAPGRGAFAGYGLFAGIRIGKARMSLHLARVHFGPCQDACIFGDVANSSALGLDPASSYFQDVTMTHSGRTFIHCTNRYTEVNNAGAAAGGGARGLLFLERCLAENVGGLNAAGPDVGGTNPAPAFIFSHAGNVLMRDCSHAAGAYNVADTQAGANPAGTIFRSILCAGERAGGQGTFYDAQGFQTTRLALDNFTIASGATTLFDSEAIQTHGVGSLEVWNGFAWKANGTGKTVLGLDYLDGGVRLTNDAVDGRPQDTNNGLSNNTRFDVGSGLTVGLVSAIGLTRFYLPGVTDLNAYAGWQAGTKIKRGNITGALITLNAAEINGYLSAVAERKLPPGLTFNALTGEIAGSASLPWPSAPSSQWGAFGNNSWPQHDVSGAAGANVAATASDVFGVDINGSALGISDSPAVTFGAGNPTMSQTQSFTIAQSPSVVFSAGMATVTILTPAPFVKGINFQERYVNDANFLWKDGAYDMGPWQYRESTGVVLAPHESLGGVTVKVDANGYPDFTHPDSFGRTVVGILFQAQSSNRYPAGTYSMRWNGLAANCQMLPSGAVTSQTPVPGGQDVVIDSAVNSIVAVHVLGAISDLHVWLPGMLGTDINQPMHTLPAARTLEVVDPAGFVRWVWNTGAPWCSDTLIEDYRLWTPDGTWPHKKLSDPSQWQKPTLGRSGTAWELVVRASAQLNRAPWFCVPHLYTPAMIDAAFDYLDANLPPGMAIAIELSNEMWNPGFSVYAWIGANSDGTQAGRGAFIASQVAILFQKARTRFVSGRPVFTVLMGHNLAGANDPDTEFLDSILNALPNIPANFIDFMGCAAYVRNPPAESAYTASVTPEQIIDDARSVCLPGNEMHDAFVAHRNLIATRSVLQQTAGGPKIFFVVYEAGQGILPKVIWFSQFVQAQTHPNMALLYADLHAMFADPAIKVDGVAYFALCSQIIATFGAWGHLQDYYQVTGSGVAPKWDAIAGTRALLVGNAAPLTLTAFDGNVVTDGALTQVGSGLLTFTAQNGTRVLGVNMQATMTFSAGLASLSTGMTQVGSPQIVFSAQAPAGDIFFTPQGAANRLFAPPEVLSPPLGAAGTQLQVANVFFNPSLPPRPEGRRCIIFSAAQLYTQRLPSPTISVLDPARSWLFRRIQAGWTIIEVGSTGVRPSAPDPNQTFDGIGTSRWNDFAAHSPEKDLCYAFQWAVENAASLGIDARKIFVAGQDSAATVALLLQAGPITFSAATSNQAKRPIAYAGVVALDVLASWWKGVIQSYDFAGFGALHWLDSLGNLATDLADVAPGVLSASSPDRAFRGAQTKVKTTPVFMAFDEAAQQTDISRDGSGDPSVFNVLDPGVTQHPYWNGLILWDALQALGAQEIGPRLSVLAVSTSPVDLRVPADPSNRQFAGSVLDLECTTFVEQFLDQAANNFLLADSPTITFSAGLATKVANVTLSIADIPSMTFFAHDGTAPGFFAQQDSPRLTFTAGNPTRGLMQVGSPQIQFIANTPDLVIGNPTFTVVDAPILAFIAGRARWIGAPVATYRSKLFVRRAGMTKFFVRTSTSR